LNINRKKKLLFIHTGGLGDIILLYPALKILKEKLGEESEIDLLVENRAFAGSKELFNELHTVDKVKVFDFKGKFSFFKIAQLMSEIRGYDTIISSGSSPLIAVLLYLSGAKTRIGFKSKTHKLLTHAVEIKKNTYTPRMLYELVKPIVGEDVKESLIPTINKIYGENPVEELSENCYFLLHPGVSQLSITKKVLKTPGPKFWVDFINKLAKLYPHKMVVLMGGPDEAESNKKIAEEVHAKNFLNISSRKFNIIQLADLIGLSELFVCLDSAPMHLAIALNAKTISLFGPTDPSLLVPPIGKDLIVFKVDNLLCQPCLWRDRAVVCNMPLCLSFLDPESLIEKVKTMV
jgi:ADP-heptose:LPS heptosyltransferase